MTYINSVENVINKDDFLKNTKLGKSLLNNIYNYKERVKFWKDKRDEETIGKAVQIIHELADLERKIMSDVHHIKFEYDMHDYLETSNPELTESHLENMKINFKKYSKDQKLFNNVLQDLKKIKNLSRDEKALYKLLDDQFEYFKLQKMGGSRDYDDVVDRILNKNGEDIYKLMKKLNIGQNGKSIERKRSRPKRAKPTFRSGDSQGKDMIRNMNRMTGATLKRFR